MSILQGLWSQEAMHIHTVRIKSSAHPAIQRAQRSLASGQQCTGSQRLCTVSTLLPVCLWLKVAVKSAVWWKKNTHIHTPLHPVTKVRKLALKHTAFKLSKSIIAPHQMCPRWHLAVCVRVLLCRPICVGSKVMAGPGRSYRWADENSRGSV